MDCTKSETVAQLEGYTDVDWARYNVNIPSTLRFVFSLDSEAISWSNKKKLIVALSSIEPEYRDVIIATCEVV